MAPKDALDRLARQIETAQKVERPLVDSEIVGRMRREGASDLHRICADFAAALNARLNANLVELSPATYAAEDLRETGPNLIQISSQGRQMQIAFQAPAQLTSTEKFLIPYILEGEVRTYNQSMLERFDIRSRMIFLCVENERAQWRFFDWRTRQTGLLAVETLVGLMGPLF